MIVSKMYLGQHSPVQPMSDTQARAKYALTPLDLVWCQHCSRSSTQGVGNCALPQEVRVWMDFSFNVFG